MTRTGVAGWNAASSTQGAWDSFDRTKAHPNSLKIGYPTFYARRVPKLLAVAPPLGATQSTRLAQMNDESETRRARIFVGLKVNSDIADQLAALVGELRGTRARLVSASDIHVTLVPPWQETSLDQAIGSLRKVAGPFTPFSLKFLRLRYGPQPRRPNLLWVDCAATDEITALRNSLMRAFGQEGNRPFRPHVTLARIRDGERSFARRHPIDRDLDLVQMVKTIELFQSPPPGATGYQVLASVELRGRAGAAEMPPGYDYSRLISNSSQE